MLKHMRYYAKTYLPLLFSLYVIWFWINASTQFVRSYYRTGLFDVSVVEYFIFVVLLFTPLVTFAALVITIYIKFFRLKLWMRKNLTYSKYSIDYSPAEAGIILDYLFNVSEVIATLLDLHFRKILNLEVRGNSLYLELSDTSRKSLSLFEAELLKQLFEREKYRSFNGCTDINLKKIGTRAHKVLLKWTKESDVLMRLIPKKVEPFVPLLLMLATLGFLVSLVSGWTIIFDGGSAQTLGSPTYPVYPIELLMTLLITLWGGIIILSGFWPRFSNNHKSKPVAAWVKTYGLKMFLKVVYSDRFSSNKVSQQAIEEIKKYTPYMIAFNLVPNDTKYLKQVLKAFDK